MGTVSNYLSDYTSLSYCDPGFRSPFISLSSRVRRIRFWMQILPASFPLHRKNLEALDLREGFWLIDPRYFLSCQLIASVHFTRKNILWSNHNSTSVNISFYLSLTLFVTVHRNCDACFCSWSMCCMSDPSDTSFFFRAELRAHLLDERQTWLEDSSCAKLCWEFSEITTVKFMKCESCTLSHPRCKQN